MKLIVTADQITNVISSDSLKIVTVEKGPHSCYRATIICPVVFKGEFPGSKSPVYYFAKKIFSTV